MLLSSFWLAGGLIAFLFGLHTVSRSLNMWAGRSLRRWLARMTGHPVAAFAGGCILTAVIQSSSATNVIVVGFVHAGLLDLSGAVSVMLGANVGTTVTSQLIAFQMTEWAPAFVAAGLLLHLSRHRGATYVGEAAVGFGGLLLGLEAMRTALAPLTTGPFVQHVLTYWASQPYAAVGAGAVLTAVVQSSSAVAAMAMTLATTGMLQPVSAIGLVLGANVGTVATTLLATVGTRPAAKRAAVADLLFNVFGVIVFLPILPAFAEWMAATAMHVERQVANAHTVFNVITALLVLPFVRRLAKLVTALVPGNDGEEGPPRGPN